MRKPVGLLNSVPSGDKVQSHESTDDLFESKRRVPFFYFWVSSPRGRVGTRPPIRNKVPVAGRLHLGCLVPDSSKSTTPRISPTDLRIATTAPSTERTNRSTRAFSRHIPKSSTGQPDPIGLSLPSLPNERIVARESLGEYPNACFSSPSRQRFPYQTGGHEGPENIAFFHGCDRIYSRAPNIQSKPREKTRLGADVAFDKSRKHEGAHAYSTRRGRPSLPNERIVARDRAKG